MDKLIHLHFLAQKSTCAQIVLSCLWQSKICITVSWVKVFRMIVKTIMREVINYTLDCHITWVTVLNMMQKFAVYY